MSQDIQVPSDILLTRERVVWSLNTLNLSHLAHKASTKSHLAALAWADLVAFSHPIVNNKTDYFAANIINY